MGLNLKEFTVPDTEIESKEGEKFIVTPELTPELFEEIQKLHANVKENVTMSFVELDGIVIKWLSLKNDPVKSERFWKSLGMVTKNYVSKFMFNYLTESIQLIVKKKSE